MTTDKTLLALLLHSTATASATGTLHYATANGAIDGYDAVAFFTDGDAKRVSPDITVER
jgi:hypothetical protein